MINRKKQAPIEPTTELVQTDFNLMMVGEDETEDEDEWESLDLSSI
jgi:hypothetical protein